MRYLIDTNIFIFLGFENDKLTSEVKEIILKYENQMIISVDSVREVLLLIKSGRINIKGFHTYDDIKHFLDEYGIEVRHTTDAHLKTLSRLIPAPYHSDPIDLMIISQAIAENIPLISSDAKFPLYAKQGLRFIHNRR